MEIFFEIFFELIFELIFEGSFEIGTSKKVSMPIRILAMIIFLIVVGGFLTLFLLIALQIMKNSAVLGWMVILLDFFCWVVLYTRSGEAGKGKSIHESSLVNSPVCTTPSSCRALVAATYSSLACPLSFG